MPYGGREIRQLIRGKGNQEERWTFHKAEGEKHFMGGRKVQFVGVGGMGSFVLVRPFGGHSLGRKGCLTLPSQKRNAYRTSPSGWHARGSVGDRKTDLNHP